jgi:hypothetical protein
MRVLLFNERTNLFPFLYREIKLIKNKRTHTHTHAHMHTHVYDVCVKREKKVNFNIAYKIA